MRLLIPFTFCFIGCVHEAVPPTAPATMNTQASTGLVATDIDKMLEAEWQKAGVAPSARATDVQWLRRLYVDMIGSLPPPDAVLQFAADTSPKKREKAVDSLLTAPAFVQHWTDYWDDELMGQARGGPIDRSAFRAWLKARIAENTSWDKIVFSLVTANGVQSPGGPRNPFATATEEPGVNGAVNYLLKFENPNDLAGNVSRTFLGVQIQCAQCHDHKTEAWKQDDFRKFAACFARVRIQPVNRNAKMGINMLVLEDVAKPVPRVTGNPELAPIAKSQPTALDGTDLSQQENVRKALASWITSKENPWFSKELVNRVWAHFLGRGFVNPVDDLRPGNPPDAPELWDTIAKDFTEHGYDTKRLLKTIALTEAYALSPNPGAQPSNTGIKLWSRFHVVPMGPDELVGALFAATDLDELATKATRQDPEEVRQRMLAMVLFVFNVDEEFDKPAYEGTITQALVLMNGRATAGGSSAIPGTTLRSMIEKGATDEAIITDLYLRTVSRKPTTEELGRAVQYIADAKVKPPPPKITIPPALKPTKNGDPLARAVAQTPADARAAAFEDLFWSLLNSSEFFFNH